MLCQYSKLFGEPSKGLHKYRICNIAIIDVLMTILGAILIDYIFNKVGCKVNYWCVLFVLFVLGIVLHRLFCVKTTIDVLLFGN